VFDRKRSRGRDIGRVRNGSVLQGIAAAKSAALGLLLGVAFGRVAMAQSVDIPLQLQQTSDGLSLNINVGIGGQNPQSYIFDTGSPVFNAYYSASAFGSIPSNMSSPTALFPNGLPTGVQIDYGDGSAIFGNLVGVPSLTFYPTASTPGGSSTGVTLNAITPSGAPSAFIINAIYKYQIPGGPSSSLQSARYRASMAELTESSAPGTTAGYVVAANGQPLSAVPTGPDPQGIPAR
jgi:hypothetical protein